MMIGGRGTKNEYLRFRTIHGISSSIKESGALFEIIIPEDGADRKIKNSNNH